MGAFYPVKLSCFAEKDKVRQKYPYFIRGHPYELRRRPLQTIKNYRSPSFFMNPFEYGKSFIDKLFLKRFGTLTQTKP